MFKPIRLIPDDTKIQFMRASRFGFFLSGLLCAASILLFAFLGLNYGVDFKGGTNFVIRFPQAVNLDELRTQMNGLGVGEVEIQGFGEPTDVSIRIEAQEGDEAQKTVTDKVKAALGSNVEYLSIESLGPKVSGELTEQGTIAVVTAIIAIVIYIWFRFEWQFSIGAVVSLLHDVLLTIGLFSILRLDFNLSIVAAILTIVGYSLNDTVVVFDRIREFMRKYKQMPLADLIDFSINSVLPRTLLTSVTALLALLALYIWGGEVLRGFTFCMIWGVLIGTYSSIFIASPILILLGTNRDSLGGVRVKAEKAKP
jgi:preprotein translocase SecF subunit